MVGDPAARSEAALDRLLEETVPTASRLARDDPLTAATGLTAERARALFEDQVLSRAIDVLARDLKARGVGYYTIASAGHEMNVVLGARLRPTDPCFLHYRSGALMMARARHDPPSEPVGDVVLSLLAAADDPVAQGRHKVWGSRPLWVVPQTSTVASHLPKAVGTAFAHSRLERLDVERPLPSDAIVCCSFGDASANHATALAGINAARYAHRRGSPLPILFVCEDNGLGISVRTPAGWIEETFAGRRHLAYVRADGEIDEVWEQVGAAIRRCRDARTPVFLHLPTVRLWGHAGSDVESAYRDRGDIAADASVDPVLRTARRLLATGAATPTQLSSLVASARQRVRDAADDLAPAPPLASRAEVEAPLAPSHPERVRSAAEAGIARSRRRSHHGRLPEEETAAGRRTLAACINAALHDEMLRRPEVVVFGEDVARKGGVYGVTGGLVDAFGSARVFDTLLDETTILGTAQGAGLLGLLPVPEIQYLAYVHNALDQIRGEAASLSFFSAGQFTNPMVVRVASFAYQEGFGGHFHNDNAIGALRDIPGVVIAAPARGDDAARMLRSALAMAAEDGRVVVFLEPIALYHQRDLHAEGDQAWLTDYPAPGTALLPGEVGLWGPEDADVLIVTYANGLRMSLRATARLEAEDGVRARVLDLRWLAPLPLAAVREEAARIGRVLIADECRATGGGVADAVVADLVESGVHARVATVRSADSYVPLGPAAGHVLLGEADILAGLRRLAP